MFIYIHVRVHMCVCVFKMSYFGGGFFPRGEEGKHLNKYLQMPCYLVLVPTYICKSHTCYVLIPLIIVLLSSY